MSSRARYIVGIDLGTTNCAVAYVDTRGKERPTADIRPFEVTQLVAPGEVAPRAMLPSFLYLPGPHELPPGAAGLPWRDDADRIVGEFARVQGGRVPGRLVSSAKSWLCHAGVDREADILPWAAPEGVRKVSPVDASADYLRQIVEAWDFRFAREDPAGKLAQQEVVLTVPASFDEAARELTLLAAKRAGLDRPILLEEPQAAFYCWIVSHQDNWQREVRGGELILVCDVGGGTTDFSLITVVETPDGPGFRRVAVGDHLMLGGDNIDLALAHTVEAKLGGPKLDAEQWSALRLACRTAKEKLLGDRPPERWPVTIAGRGSKLIGGAIQSDLSGDEIRQVVLDGFFPRVDAAEGPSRTARPGLQEFGLPFVPDPAIPRHLAAFLRRHRAESNPGETLPSQPDAILFNGGALTPPIVRDRIVATVASWAPSGSKPPRVLTNASLDLAVSAGAAYYGVVRRGSGIRIGGGTARSFYVGFEGGADSPPWLCVVPRDAQEGDSIAIRDRDFELVMGRPVSFPMASSSVRADDRPGDLVAADADTIRDLPPLLGTMRVGRKAKAERVPVRLEARVTEVGTVELWCQSRTDDRRWGLQILLRAAAAHVGGPPAIVTGSTEADRVVIEQSELDAAIAAIRVAFAPNPPDEASGPARLVKRLEELLDLTRDAWPPSALRALWEPLREAADRRLAGPRHESRWFNLAGFCLRPGVGLPLDDARMKALWPTWHQSVKHVKDAQCWAEWWIMWRRVSAGLARAHQEEIHRRVAPFLQPGRGDGAAKKAGRPRPESHEIAEIWRCVASLERLPGATKSTLGSALLDDLSKPNPPSHAAWCLGRLGARVPLYGPANTAVPRDAAARWVEALIDRPVPPGREATDLAFALGQLARVSGDRARDLDEPTRTRVADRMAVLGSDEATMRSVLEYREREAGEQGQALGDALPVGLHLVAEPAPAAG